VVVRFRIFSSVVSSAVLVSDLDKETLSDSGWIAPNHFNNSGIYEAEFNLQFPGVLAVEVKVNGEASETSPVFVLVDPGLCPHPNQLLGSDGVCRCETGYSFALGRCMSSTRVVIFVGLAVTVAVAVLIALVLAFSASVKDSAWTVDGADLLFTDPPAKLGEGKYGPIYRACYKTALVAAKVLPAQTHLPFALKLRPGRKRGSSPATQRKQSAPMQYNEARLSQLTGVMDPMAGGSRMRPSHTYGNPSSGESHFFCSLSFEERMRSLWCVGTVVLLCHLPFVAVVWSSVLSWSSAFLLPLLVLLSLEHLARMRLVPTSPAFFAFS
jgi:hypothetical protein